MPTDWPVLSLGDLFHVKHGLAFKGEYFTDEPQKAALVTPGNFAIGGGFQDGKRKYFLGPIPSDYILKPGQVIVTMTDLSKEADTLGYAARIPEGSLIWLHNQRIGLLEFRTDRQTHHRFIEYLLRAREYRAWVVGSATGTTVKHTSPGRIEAFRCPIPPYASQERIAHILGALDDKIELNRRMALTLEEMARAIFRSWFVDFDPVRAKAEGRPTNLPTEIDAFFPESFVDSSIGSIPAGWPLGKLGDVSQNIRRPASVGSIKPDEPFVGLDSISRRSLALMTWDFGEKVESQKSRFKVGEILFGKLRPYFHKVCIAPLDGVCSTDILVINSMNPSWYSFVAMMLSEVSTIDFVTAASDGTRMPRTKWEDLSRMPIVMPPTELVEHFNTTVRPLLTRVQRVSLECQTLAAIRNTLLPKLISGEVRITA